LVVREASLDEYMSRYLADRIERDPRIQVFVHTEVRELEGERGRLEAVIVDDTVSGERQRLPARELMVFIGGVPSTSWLPDSVIVDAGGYVMTGADARRATRNDQPSENNRAPENGQAPERTPLMLETSLPGLFAAGDVRSGSIKRVASAVGEGAMAVRMVHEHLATAR
jgi:thioredoxin reductase (NADPH)